MRRLVAQGFAVCFVTLTIAGFAASAAAGSIAVRWVKDVSNPGKMFVELSGLPAEVLADLGKTNRSLGDWQTILPVYVAEQNRSETSPMFGAYTIEQTVIRFEPAFALEKGVAYKTMFHPERLPGQPLSGGHPIAAEFKIARPRTSTTVVRQIYPTARLVPENLLKFYIHFSAPMSRGDIYSYIHLKDESGKEVELPFLEIGEELWNTSMTRLTLFVDPGRIKRGVRPLVEMGPVLEAGEGYRLVVDRHWKDANGNPLKENFEKHFRAGPPDREIPQTEKWKIVSPKPDTAGPLTVLFPKAMDHALALRMIQVVDGAGAPVRGLASLADQERRWSFVPERSWSRQTYKLIVVSTLEDLAGNSIAKLFDVDVFEPQVKISEPTIALPFPVK